MGLDGHGDRTPPVTSARGVTIVACGDAGCPHAEAAPDGCDAAVRAAVRATPHGMLVRTGCPRGGVCTPGEPSPGPRLIVQSCDASRRPTGPALVVGPLHETADVEELCGWLRAGAPTPAPAHLVAGVLAPSSLSIAAGVPATWSDVTETHALVLTPHSPPAG